MLKIDDLVTIEIDNIAFGGSGVGRFDGLAVFVPLSIPGETIEARVIEIKKNYALAKIESIKNPSQKRQSPPCQYFGKCQGCVYQHMDYKEELKIKTSQVKDIFERLAHISDPPVLPATPCPHEYGYRNKVRLRYKQLKDNKKLFGYIIENRKRTLDIESCLIASPLINKILSDLRNNDFDFFGKQNIRSHNLTLIEDGINSYTALEKKAELKATVNNKIFNYSINSFFQVNRSIFNSLIEYLLSIITKLDLQDAYLCDLYCGVGFFGILLSEHFKHVHFVEQNRVSCRFLEKNIKENNIENAKVINADTEAIIESLTNKYDVIIIDPPRSGCDDKVCASLAEMKPKKLIYISCNPATMARDIEKLTNLGFTLESLKPFDFFPKTKHIEVVAILRL
ncbi:MAG: class I SAM-dependent RNA methyltransferase [Candidatus Aureabacteria bacterium]|nr:class I SAM-dependent RNA methyltransferase [Candidatus Auribacterota bacterium]